MQIDPTYIPDVKVLTPKVHSDDRGYFIETYSERVIRAAGIAELFVQDNHTYSRDTGVVRGLHFQKPPHAQAKFVRVIRGAILDIAVDIRRSSPTFGQHVAVELSEENRRQIFIPAGFAHGLVTLLPNTEVLYKVSALYAPDCDCGILWNDPALGIQWPVGLDQAILSEKDRKQPLLSESQDLFE